MGFLSGLFGGGSSGSSSSTTNNTVEVKPVTNLNIDLEELAQALQVGNANEFLTESAKVQLMAQEQQINASTEAQKLELEKINLSITQKSIKTLESFIPLIAIGSIYLIFIKKKRR